METIRTCVVHLMEVDANELMKKSKSNTLKGGVEAAINAYLKKVVV